jgi:hypothetical protein
VGAELLAIVSLPVVAPAAVGSNWTFSVAVCPGFRVRGKVIPETEKPVPDTVAELTLTGAVPADVRVTGCVAFELSTTLPKVTLPALMLNIGTAAAEFN